MADLFEETAAICGRPKEVSNWLMVEAMRLLKEHEMDPDRMHFTPAHLAALIGLVEQNVVNRNVAKTVFEEIFLNDVDPERYVEEKGLKVVSDEGALQMCIRDSRRGCCAGSRNCRCDRGGSHIRSHRRCRH